MATSEREISQDENRSTNKTNESNKTLSMANASMKALSDNAVCNMQDEDSICSMNEGNVPRTSTPNRRQRLSRISNSSSGLGTGDNVSNVDSDDLNGIDVSQTSSSSSAPYNVPILGYEVMEERTRFTVFKIRVEHQSTGRSWFVFRRYTDFVRLNKKLKVLFKGVMLSLPPKRWFGSNFDPLFLEDRVSGLQTYITSLLKHQEICHSKLVRDFFCLDDPPDPHDSIEEMRALWESLEEKVYNLRCQIREKDGEIEYLHARIAMLKSQISSLLQSLKLECSLTSYAHNQTGKQTVSTLSNSENHSTTSRSVSHLHDLNLAIAHMIEKSLADMDDENNGIEVGLDATLLCSERYSSCSSLLDQQASDAKSSEISEEKGTVVQEHLYVKNRENHIPAKTTTFGATKNRHIPNESIVNHITDIRKQQNEQSLRTYGNGVIATKH